MDFSIPYAMEILPALLRGAVITVVATAGGFALALVLGLLIAVMRTSKHRTLQMIATAYVYLFRSTPLLVQLFFLFFVLPFFGIVIPALPTGILGLGLNFAASTAEVYRGGILAVPREQWEAAQVLNLPTWRTWSRIILPQAIPPVRAPLANYGIAMYKDTTLLATITVRELLGSALAQASESYRYLEPLTLVALIFLALSLPLAFAVRRLESRNNDPWEVFH